MQHSGQPNFLCVDRFLQTELGTLALASAFDLKVIDHLLVTDYRGEDALRRQLRLAPPGLALLVDLLIAAAVIRRGQDGEIDLTEDFRAALAFRDLLEAKLRFFRLVAADFAGHFTDFLADLPRFIAKSSVFELFRYDRCLQVTPENLAGARRWVSYTTALTRYEAEVCFDRIDLSNFRRMLDIGGNSGEFVLNACRRNAGLAATVFDLPVVCALGREHVASVTEGDRINFVAGDMRTDPLPSAHDLLTFKSVLHDWPEPDMLHILDRAARRLEPGGTLLIFERGPVDLRGSPMTASAMLNLVFAPFYRPAPVYADALASLGFLNIASERVDIDSPFHLVTARKPK